MVSLSFFEKYFSPEINVFNESNNVPDRTPHWKISLIMAGQNNPDLGNPEHDKSADSGRQ